METKIILHSKLILVYVVCKQDVGNPVLTYDHFTGTRAVSQAYNHVHQSQTAQIKLNPSAYQYKSGVFGNTVSPQLSSSLGFAMGSTYGGLHKMI